MKVLVFRNQDEASLYAANMVLEKVKAKSDIRLGLATGSTPIKMYQNIVKDKMDNGTNWSSVITFNLDEYKGLKNNDENSYHYFMRKNLFDALGMDEKQSYFPNAKDDYEDLIDEAGGIDVQILGIGQNGHIAFNEPGSSEYSRTRLVDLTPETIKVNSDKFFNGNLKKTPKQAYTMGIKTIMSAKQIILLAFGAEKSEAIQKVLRANQYDSSCPATALIKHPNVIVIVDNEVNLGM